jgi:hypothetical protein
MEENIYKSPESNLESPSDVGNNTFKNSKFKKTIVMNVVGGILLGLVCLFSFLSKALFAANISVGGVSLFYVLLTFIAFGSAYTIKVPIKSFFQMAMLVLNWFCILLFVLCSAGMFIAMYSDPKFKDVFWVILILFALLFLIPQVINIKAFMALRK